MDLLAMLAEHNAWANQRILAAAGRVPADALEQKGQSYESALDILRHLVQVEHSFLALAHGHERSRLHFGGLSELAEHLVKLDASYVDYARSLDPEAARSESFLVPWFGFEITRAEGILQPLTHSHKHRSDVSMLLPALGGEGIEMDLIRWIAESRGPSDGSLL